MTEPVIYHKMMPLNRSLLLVVQSSDDVFMAEIAAFTMERVRELDARGDLAVITMVNVRRSREGVCLN